MAETRAATPRVQARPAATVVLVRDAESGPEVLLLRRDRSAVFGAGAHVFPGGRVEASDRSRAAADLCEGMDDTEASRSLGLTQGGLAYWVAAIRECFEEAGLLLASGTRAQEVAAEPYWRESLMRGETTLVELCRRHGLRFAAGRLRYFSRWVTPRGPPRRFDARFFIAPALPGQTATACRRETFEPCWIRPVDALEAARNARIQAMYPTQKTLESMAGYASAADVMTAALRRAPAVDPAAQPPL